MRFLPISFSSLLVELSSLDETLALFASLQGQPINGVRDCVPAAKTVLVHFSPLHTDVESLIAEIRTRELVSHVSQATSRLEIPVYYQGEDLNEVARLLAMSVDELIACHTGQDYTVAFTGFAPGFAYLVGGHPALNVPRRATPRTRIPAGSVALAGTFSGVYPQASPGGWQIIGTTPLRMWDISRQPAALMQPGSLIRFVNAGRESLNVLSSTSEATPEPLLTPASSIHDSELYVEVIATGLQSIFQDAGRFGQTAQGVVFSGAMDQASLRMANRLVGNPLNTPVIECVNGGLTLRFNKPAVVAVTGAQTPISIHNDHTQFVVDNVGAIAVNAGEIVCLGTPQAGLRNYVAVQGGFNVAPILGSVATDILANVGPPALRTGDQIPLNPPSLHRLVDLVDAPTVSNLPVAGHTVLIDVLLGPRTDWFTLEALELFTTQEWLVTPQSNRVGLRLQGDQTLTRQEHAELPSEGAVKGAVQVPANGQPLIFGADHPLTAGYPIIAVIADYHLDLLGQVPVGAKLRFRPVRDFLSC